MRCFASRFGAWVGAAMILWATGASAQDPFDQFDRPVFGGVVGMAPPPPPPLTLQGFELHYRNPTVDPEQSIALRWTTGSAGADYMVFRQRLQVVKGVDSTGFMAFTLPQSELVAPGGWTEIATVPPDQRAFTDQDIPPVDLTLLPIERRALGEVYCYRAETTVESRQERLGIRKAISPVVCTRLRGLNAPSVRIASMGPGAITLMWQNNSQMRVDGYEVQYWEDLGGAVQSVILVGDGALRHTVAGLNPGKVYCGSVKTMDYYRSSQAATRRCVRTQAEPDPEPEIDERTFTVTLTRQQVVSDNPVFIPYVGRFPTSGLLPKGKLLKVELNSVWPSVFFVKPGHSTAECADADALVTLLPGQTLPEQGMIDAFGAAEPDLPILFVSCIGNSGPLLEWVPIKITYVTD